MPSATLDAVLLSFEQAVRHGVPAPMAERLVMTTAQRGVSPHGIEAITRAIAYGAGHGASLRDLETFADHGLNRGVTADAIALGILSPEHGEAMKTTSITAEEPWPGITDASSGP